MGVSASGSDRTFTTVRRLGAGVAVVFVVLAYLYGPAVSPAMHTAAIGQCNDHAEGNWRSFRLTWVVGVYPHWSCSDESAPTENAVSLGWWTSPFDR